MLDGLKDILLDNDDLIEAFAASFNAEVTRRRKQRVTRQRPAQTAPTKVLAGGG